MSVVSMNKIALWINVCPDDWTAERPIITNNEFCTEQVKNSFIEKKEAKKHEA